LICVLVLVDVVFANTNDWAHKDRDQAFKGGDKNKDSTYTDKDKLKDLYSVLMKSLLLKDKNKD